VSARLTIAPGVFYWASHLDKPAQHRLVEEVFRLAQQAPFYRAGMPRTGKQLSVQMTNFGPLGWYTDAAGGYRYERCHPVLGTPWPSIPAALLRIWTEATEHPEPPEACLVNLYRDGARMGLHRDEDEQDLEAPVVSVSLGDSARFRFGPARSGASTQNLILNSGDVLVFGGPARLMFHGIDRVQAGTSQLIPGGGRINLTLRRVSARKKEATDQGGDRSPNALFALDTGRG
jgi:alkylated DNA repair protein (DNA oxidative demethylase)